MHSDDLFVVIVYSDIGHGMLGITPARRHHGDGIVYMSATGIRTCLQASYGSLEHRETADEPVRAHAEVLVVNAALPGVHLDERVADDVLKEGAGVDLAENEAKRVRARVAEDDELVARGRLVEVQLVCGGLVVDELLVPAVRCESPEGGEG